MTQRVEIYTDGACRGNPGPGGWGALLIYGEKEKTLWGGEKDTTNNRMELTAAIKGLDSLKRHCKVMVMTDSSYVKKGITEWIQNWKAKGWKNSNKKPVKNIDLWKQLDELSGQHDIEWKWIKGHSGHKYNEIADDLANRGVDELADGGI